MLRKSTVTGAKSVENSMAVKVGNVTAGNTVDDSVITTRVKSALLADSLISSTDIAVVTSKAKVQLSGFTDSKAQIDRAVSVAAATLGVEKVLNKLQVKK